MPAPTEGAPGRRLPRLAAAVVAALLLVVAVWLGVGQTWAQGDDSRRAAVADAAAEHVDRVISDPDTTTAELEILRDQLVVQRTDAQTGEKQLQPPVAEVEARIKALGEPPPEGVTEAPEIAERRKDLNQQLATAMGPVLEARDAFQRADGQIAEIDRLVRARFSAELMSHGPTPLRPLVWATAIDEIGAKLGQYRRALAVRFEDPVNRSLALSRLPVDLLILVVAIGVSLLVRRALIRWVDRRLQATPSRHAAAWVVALRNLTRLIVPIVVAGIVFASLDPEGLVARAGKGRVFEVPGFVLVVIGALWLAASLFSPRNELHRLLPVDNALARRGAWTVMGLGLIIALARYGAWAIQRFDFAQETQTAIFFPLVLLGALGLVHAARVIDGIRHRLTTLVGASVTPTIQLGLGFLRWIARAVTLVAAAGPLAALAGYVPLGAYLVFSSIMTLGLLGAGIIVHDLLTKTAMTFLSGPASAQDDPGLIPVISGTLVALGAVPLLALTWGARTSDLSEVWARLNQGVTLGGMRLSFGVILTLVVVFALGAAVTRVVQTVMRSSVLPRTRIDTGGKNALVAGIGYLGFVVAALAAVSAAGLDLSNIAIVAGALSVGIGFGLQNLVSNFVSGIILLVERPVKEGDWIEVSGFSGYVKGINVRSTEIQTFDRASVIVPNSDLVAGTVLNRTHTGTSGRVQIPVGVSYESDPRQVEAILRSIAEEHPLVLEDPAPVVLFMGFSVNTMDFEMRCWLRDVNFSLSVRSDVNFEVVRRFRAEGVEFRVPPPVQHVHKLDEVSAEFMMAAQASAASGAKAAEAKAKEAKAGDAEAGKEEAGKPVETKPAETKAGGTA